ncbi:phenoloxidase-activating factor 2 [Drosophila biarmipes]|uniref:phenoloxidase-activating factor 2 n=1 Tax=Drosophila biarmipes TaxID=125945 RepID=UPI0007E5CE7B|nr:phenoloxidase-activating factor 2 [Drosophila biarmipes]
MVRLSILCLLLGLYGVQSLFCDYSGEKECVPRNLCRIGTESGIPSVQFRTFANGNQGCPAAEICCHRSEMLAMPVSGPVPDQWTPPDCGHANRDGRTFKKYNAGDTAQEAELPWMVVLLDARYFHTVGGGSLIKPDVVLTATSVIRKIPEEYLLARAGEWDLNSNAELGKHKDLVIRKIVPHPYFSETTGANNVALLFLDSPLPLSSHINLICLPPPNRAFIPNRCIVSGWGKRTMNDVSFIHALKKIEVPLVDSFSCEQQLRRPYTAAFTLHNSLLCAGGEIGKDSCEGDGGAPLACPLQGDPNRYEQVGIVNFGAGCGEPIPAAYTDVSKMLPWINHQIQLGTIGTIVQATENPNHDNIIEFGEIPNLQLSPVDMVVEEA